MRARLWLCLLGGGAAACANILGIEDGIPRVIDSGVDATLDAMSTTDAGSDAPYSALHCGASECNAAAGEGCCWNDAGYACVDAASACKAVYVPCDRPEQCVQGDAGPVECCGTYVTTDAGAITSSVACALRSQCVSTNDKYILCGDDSGVECIPDASCGPSTFTLPTFLICK